MNQIKAFLAKNGVGADTLATWDDNRCRTVAKAMGYKVATVRVEEYTPQQGKKGTGMYLITEGSGKPWYNRLCDGNTLTPAGRDAALGLADAIRAAVE